jgi:hypothetical protein
MPLFHPGELTDVDEKRTGQSFIALTSLFSVELPGIEPVT